MVLKTAEPGIGHKTEAGGVHLELRDEAAVEAAYDDLAGRLGPRVLVQQMAHKGVEVGLGAVNDKDFGPYVMVAAGGVLIELLDDRAVTLAPVTQEHARMLVGRLRLMRLLKGLRGRPPGDVNALADALSRLSHLAFDLRDYIAELDINPLIITEAGCVAVDALAVRTANSPTRTETRDGSQPERR